MKHADSGIDLDRLPPKERLVMVRRQVLRMTQEQLAERLSGELPRPVSKFTIANVEAGRRNPGLALALALEKTVGIPANAWVPRQVAEHEEVA